MAGTVKIACSVMNGVSLQLTRPIPDGTGVEQSRRYGGKVILAGPTSPRDDAAEREVVTEIDSAFWTTWLAQNPNNSLLADGAIRALEA